MNKGGRHSRDKGARGERAWGSYLTAQGWPSRRGIQFQGGAGSPDVQTAMEGVHFEVKNTEQLRIWDAMHQAIDDAGPVLMPVVAFKRNRHDWLVILTADDFCKLKRSFDDEP